MNYLPFYGGKKYKVREFNFNGAQIAMCAHGPGYAALVSEFAGGIVAGIDGR